MSINRLADTATPFKLTFNLLKAISVATGNMTQGNHFPNSVYLFNSIELDLHTHTHTHTLMWMRIVSISLDANEIAFHICEPYRTRHVGTGAQIIPSND